MSNPAEVLSRKHWKSLATFGGSFRSCVVSGVGRFDMKSNSFSFLDGTPGDPRIGRMQLAAGEET